MLRPRDNLHLTNQLSPRAERRCEDRVVHARCLTRIRQPLQFIIGKGKGYLVLLIDLEVGWLFVKHWSEGPWPILGLAAYGRCRLVPDQPLELMQTSAYVCDLKFYFRGILTRIQGEAFKIRK